MTQWTYSTRKKALYEYAVAQKASVGNLTIQLELLYKELSETNLAVLTALNGAASVKDASDIVLTDFENPAD